MFSSIKPHATVLFIGDSITDSQRDGGAYGKTMLPLGSGYPLLIASALLAAYPEKDLQFINRGFSADRSRDLDARWQKDCLSVNPDVVSILIGINDTWRAFDQNDPTSTRAFEKSMRSIMSKTRENTTTAIVVCEPFLLPVADKGHWRSDLDAKIDVLRKVSREFECTYIPLDGIFAAAACKVKPEFWAEDGVHPTLAGYGLIADAWLAGLKIP